jgi:hypothetical protein
MPWTPLGGANGCLAWTGAGLRGRIMILMRCGSSPVSSAGEVLRGRACVLAGVRTGRGVG